MVARTDETRETAMSIVDVKKFFESGGTKWASLKDFRADWEQLTEKDRAEIKAGLDDGTYNY